MKELKEIDGSTLEGGGQILRNALSLAALLQQPLIINKIRRGRKTAGLKAQHAAGVNLVGQISRGSTLKGAVKDSQEVEFIPGEMTPGTYTADTGTAGSTTLLLQIALPCLLFAPQNPQAQSQLLEKSIIKLRGGTNAIQAPQIDYTETIFLPFIRKHFDIEANLDVKMRGYYPRGGGEIVATVQARNTPLPAVTLLERGKVTSITGRVYVAGLPLKLAKDCRDAAVAALVKQGIDPAIINIPYLREPKGSHLGAGSGLLLWATTENGCIIGGSAIGAKGKEAAELGREAAEELGRNLAHGGCVDEYLQDQWIIFGALAEGKSRVRCGLPLTLHTQTAIWLAEQLTGASFTEIPQDDGTTVILECNGIGFTTPAPESETR